MAWTDDELRTAIHEAAVADGYSISIDHLRRGDVVTDREVTSFRHLLTALGIDHQPKPELPAETGSMIYGVETESGSRLPVATLNDRGFWVGIDDTATYYATDAESITSFGGVLDLDKVRGEQGA